MSLNHPRPSHNHAAEYQASGFPFVYQHGADMADLRIEFPYVTQWICITAPSGDVGIAFKVSQSDVQGGTVAMRMVIPQNSMMVLPIKCIDLYVDSNTQTDVTVMAGLTNVKRSDFPAIAALEGVDHVYVAAGAANSAKVTPA